MTHDAGSAAVSEAPSTPPGRQVVVLRQGPPKRKGIFVDAVAGVLGVALLVGAGVLGQTLPEEDIIPVQYLPEFNTTSQPVGVTYEGEFYQGSVLFTETGVGRTVEQATYVFEFDVTHDNVYQVRVHARTDGDDVHGSGQDSWKFTLFDQEGTSPDTPKSLQTRPAVLRERDPADPLADPTVIAVAQVSEINEAWRWTAAPDPDVLTGDPGFTQEEALLIASQEYTIPTKGTWRIEMRANAAGDCPATPPADPDQGQLFLACMQNSQAIYGQQGVDLGNPLTIVEVSYDYYNISVMEL